MSSRLDPGSGITRHMVSTTPISSSTVIVPPASKSSDCGRTARTRGERRVVGQPWGAAHDETIARPARLRGCV
eukprot:583850-Prymnesium_polylepis.1